MKLYVGSARTAPRWSLRGTLTISFVMTPFLCVCIRQPEIVELHKEFPEGWSPFGLKKKKKSSSYTGKVSLWHLLGVAFVSSPTSLKLAECSATTLTAKYTNCLLQVWLTFLLLPTENNSTIKGFYCRILEGESFTPAPCLHLKESLVLMLLNSWSDHRRLLGAKMS